MMIKIKNTINGAGFMCELLPRIAYESYDPETVGVCGKNGMTAHVIIFSFAVFLIEISFYSKRKTDKAFA